MDQNLTSDLEKERAKREAEELAKSIVELPQKFRDRLAGAVMLAQLETAEKAV